VSTAPAAVSEPPFIVTTALPLTGPVFHILMPSSAPLRTVLVRMMELAPSITPPQSAMEVTSASLTVMVPVE
jgi:hypothetical protein